MKEENKKTIQSVERALDILEYLVFSGNGRKLSEISEHCGLNKATAFHLIKTMESRGYIEQSPDSLRYKTGGKMFEVAMHAYRGVNLNIICQPYLEQFTEKHKETSAVFHYAKNGSITQCLCTLVVDAKNAVNVSVELGAWAPLSCTAYGKIYLSCLYDDQVKSLLSADNCPSEQKPSYEKILKTLEDIRKSHFCVEKEEYQEGIVNIAVPIYKNTGRTIASICAVLPAQRATREKIEAMTADLIPIGDTISAMPL